MSYDSHSDAELQALIDDRFQALAGTSDPGHVNQLSHALRLMVREKERRGLALSPVEHTLAARPMATGRDDGGALLRRVVVIAVVLALLVAGLWAAVHFLLPGLMSS